jgi:acyl-CoA dehydrogenase
MWTSGAQFAGWMFSLVRTDFEAAKHSGISFVLVPMDQEGGTVSPISLISGNSPFCETFLDDAIAEKRDLIGTMNEGWTIGKRLLQHERSG